MKLEDLLELDVMRGCTKFEQDSQPGSDLSIAKTMIETNNEYSMGVVGVERVNNRFCYFLWGKAQVSRVLWGRYFGGFMWQNMQKRPSELLNLRRQ